MTHTDIHLVLLPTAIIISVLDAARQRLAAAALHMGWQQQMTAPGGQGRSMLPWSACRLCYLGFLEPCMH